MSNWSPEELCRSAEGTVVFSDVNLRADTAPTAVLFQQVRHAQPMQASSRAHLPLGMGTHRLLALLPGVADVRWHVPALVCLHLFARTLTENAGRADLQLGTLHRRGRWA